MLAADDPRHGTANGYSNHGCRCDLCRVAHNAYIRERFVGTCFRCGGPISNKYVSSYCRSCFAILNAPSCPSEQSYKNGCRCDACREASAAGRRERRRRARARELAAA